MTSFDENPTVKRVEAGLGRRRRKETLFRFGGVVATLVGVCFLVAFFWTLIAQGASAFRQTYVSLEMHFSPDILAPGGELDLEYADFDVNDITTRRLFNNHKNSHFGYGGSESRNI